MSNASNNQHPTHGKHAAPPKGTSAKARTAQASPAAAPANRARASRVSASTGQARTGAPSSRAGAQSAYRPLTGGPYAVEMEPVPSRDKKPASGSKAAKVVGIVFGVIVGALLVVYLVGVAVFAGHFWPNAKMGTHDISLKTPDEITAILEEGVEAYSLRIHGDGLDVSLSANEAGVDFSAEHVVSQMFERANAWAWPAEVFSEHDETEGLAATLDESGVSDKLQSAIDAVNETAVAPENASVAYDESAKMFTVVKETYGTQIDSAFVMKAVENAVATLQGEIVLDASALAKPTILSTDQRITDAAAKANGMILVNVQFMMAGTLAATLDASVVAPCVAIADDLSVSLNEDALASWAEGVASSCSTVGTTRTYTRPDGKQVSVSGGSYGWKVDSDALLDAAKEAIESDQTGQVDVPCSQSGSAFSGVGARDWGARYIDVDLSSQHAWLYDESGCVVWESDIVSGKPSSGGGSLTPSGVYVINSNSGGSTLKGTNDDGSKYETPVTYWMPFVGNLIGFHDATWQSAFGGTRYKDGAGSHGCVNLPYSKAEALHNACRTGDVVVCHW